MSALLRASEIAPVFSVDARTVSRWADEHEAGFPASLRTPGKHRRWNAGDVIAWARAHGFAVPESWNASEAA